MARTDLVSSPTISSATATSGKPVIERTFRVVKETKVNRLGSHYTLRAGKIISSKGYDIDELVKLGVALEEVIAPSP